MEARTSSRSIPCIFFAMYGRSDLDVRGYMAGTNKILREPGETVRALRERALAATDARCFVTIYPEYG